MIPLFLENDTSSSSDDWMIPVLLLQLFVGAAQLLIAFILTILRFAAKKPLGGLRIYWIAVAVYFSVLAFLLLGFGALFDAPAPEALVTGWFFSAWLIAFYMPFFALFDPRPSPSIPAAGSFQNHNQPQN